MLLVDSLAAASPPPSADARRAAFGRHLAAAGRPSCSAWRLEVATETLRLFCERQPAEVAGILDRHAPQVCHPSPTYGTIKACYSQ